MKAWFHNYRNVTIMSLMVLVACVKPFDFDQQSYERALVIDGVLTDQPGPHIVTIAYTFAFGEEPEPRVSGAVVYVEDENGNQTGFTESEDRTYLSPANFRAQEGMSYRLVVTTPEGTTYQSEFERLIPTPEIDSIHQRHANLPDEDGEEILPGAQFFVDTHDPTGNAKYFRYEWVETYKIQTPYPARYYIHINEDSTTMEPVDTVILQYEPSPGICYTSNQSDVVLFGTTVGSSNNRLAEFPIRFVSFRGQTLRSRYSLLVRQFSISEAAYTFYKQLKENNESGGSFFDKQTGPIPGNFTSSENPEEPVLGFFEVSSVTEKRRFFSPFEFDNFRIPPFEYYCPPDLGLSLLGMDSAILFMLDPGNKGVYQVWDYAFSLEGDIIGLQVHQRQCTDCSWYASTVKPEFWID